MPLRNLFQIQLALAVRAFASGAFSAARYGDRLALGQTGERKVPRALATGGIHEPDLQRRRLIGVGDLQRQSQDRLLVGRQVQRRWPPARPRGPRCESALRRPPVSRCPASRHGEVKRLPGEVVDFARPRRQVQPTVPISTTRPAQAATAVCVQHESFSCFVYSFCTSMAVSIAL